MDPIFVRGVERIIVVLIGGMSIYLGYRLFLKLPQLESDGKITLPWDISLLLGRVGPGVFFALFGAAVVIFSLQRTVEYSEQGALAGSETAASGGATVTHRLDFAGLGSGLAVADLQAREDARALLHKDIAILNTLSRQLRPDLPEQDVGTAQRAITRIKFTLMKSVWIDRDWGDQTAFEVWLKDQSQPVAGQLQRAVEYYRNGAQP
jgi:hypothetical protein